MRRLLLIPPILLGLSCKSPLTRLEELRDAARQLRFHILKVEPNLELALPPDLPRIKLGLILGVENPTPVPFQARHIKGSLLLDSPGGSVPLSEIVLSDGLEIRPDGTSEVRATVVLGFGSLRSVWDLLTSSMARREFNGLRLEGEAKIHAYGGNWTVPLRARVRPPR